MPKTETSNSLVWFRNDLRVHDQQSLYNACMNHEQVMAIYYLDPRHFKFDQNGFKRTGSFRSKFLLETLETLKTELLNLNISLFVFRIKPEDHLPHFCSEHGISDIYYQKEWTAYEQEVEDQVISQSDSKINWHGHYDQFLFHPEDIPFSPKDIPEIFTMFRKRIEKESVVRPELEIKAKPLSNREKNYSQIPKLNKLGFKTPNIPEHTAFPFEGGEINGLNRIQEYFFQTGKLAYYKKTRNGLIGVDYSSKLSAWLANGSLSARTIYWAVKRFEQTFKKNQSTYWLIFELIWRDYFKYISMKHGNAIFSKYGIKQRECDWKIEYQLVRKWINGETASDFVNANMIELKQTGWMSNRGRQNVASYFTRDLELDWRIGAAYFESMLVDHDVHSNYGNWNYVAGIGNDPRDRKFNVDLQAKRYDSDEKFRLRWLQTNLFL
ncbi:MAG: DASH family cryptochrome [Flavobacteriaceae bacterium]|nr:DASH family cryptochrome [Bacteroidia bacterium]NNK70134.1 DASH family cryptochrome [Flavobacteriaceae bacterium]